MNQDAEDKMVKRPEGIFVVQVYYMNGHDLSFNVPREIPLFRFQELVTACSMSTWMPPGPSLIRRIEFCDPICQQPNAGVDTRNIEIERTVAYDTSVGPIYRYDIKGVDHAAVQYVRETDSAKPAGGTDSG